MTSSDKFSGSELGEMQLWEIPSVSGGAKVKNALEAHSENRPSGLLTVGDVEDVQIKAFNEASIEGRKDGYKQGYEQGEKEGYESGYEAGRKEGYEEGQARVSQQVDSMLEIIQFLDEPLDSLDQQIEEELVALSMAVARQLVRRELKTDPGQVVAVIREAMKILPVSSRNIRLFLHPEDVALVQSVLDVDDGVSSWTMVEDPLLSRGGGRIETETSRVDVTVEKRLAEVIATTLGGNREDDF